MVAQPAPETNAAPGAPPARGATQLLGVSNMLIPGLLAWTATVGLPARERDAGAAARIAAALALITLVVGPFLAGKHPRLGRAVGVHGTVGLSLLAWLLLGAVINVQRLEPVRAAIGAVAWLLFALGWGAVRSSTNVPEDDPRALPGPPLPARAQLPRGSLVLLLVGALGALGPLALAWRVTRPSHALLAHAVAVVCALALLSAAVRLAIGRESWRPTSVASARLSAAVRPLALLALVLALRFVWMLLR